MGNFCGAICPCCDEEDSFVSGPYDARTMELGSPSNSVVSGCIGLRNLGNTCFMNAGLQCLCHIEPLVMYFLKGKYQEASKIRDVGLAEAFAALMQSLWQGNKPAHSPRDLHRLFRSKAPYLFGGYQQQDVQEFFAFFLDALHEELNLVKKRPPPMTEDAEKEDERLGEKNGDEFKAALSWLRYLQRGKSFFIDLMQGQARDVLTCQVCGFEQRNFQAFLYLSLPVAATMTKVGDAVSKYLEEELLTGDEQWKCPRCKCKVDCRKRIDLWKLPPVLVLHLKRFEFDMASGRFRKLNTDLTAPLDFDLSSYVSSPQRETAEYEVVAVANHHGAFGSGHYTATCFVRDPEKEDATGKWHSFDDSNVSSISERRERVVSRDAYVIFLVRKGDVGQMIRKQSISRPEEWPHMVSTQNSMVKQLLPKCELLSQTFSETASLPGGLATSGLVPAPPRQPRLEQEAQPVLGEDSMRESSQTLGAQIRMQDADPLGARQMQQRRSQEVSATRVPVGPSAAPGPGVEGSSLPAEAPSEAPSTRAPSTGSRGGTGAVMTLGSREIGREELMTKKKTPNSLRPESAITLRAEDDGTKAFATEGQTSPRATHLLSVDALSGQDLPGSSAASEADSLEVDQELVSHFCSVGLDQEAVEMAVRKSRNDAHAAATLLASQERSP